MDIQALRAQFPILDQQVNGKPLVYLDNGATTQKPVAVLNALDNYYRTVNSNVHRGAHYLSDEATGQFEGARQTVADFLNASREEILWTKGTTESINMVAQCVARERLQPGDEVLIGTSEHHANIVPWQQACAATGATLKVIPLHDDCSLDQAAFEQLLSSKTKIFAIGHASNALGTLNPVKAMVAKAKAAGAITLVDGAQAVAHFPVDVQDLDVDRSEEHTSELQSQ